MTQRPPNGWTEADQKIIDHLRRMFENDDAAPTDDRIRDLIAEIRERKSDEPNKRETLSNQIVDVLPDLGRFARSLHHDPRRSEDLVQETALKAIANADKFTQGTNLKAWLFTIMRNQFYSEMRASKREVEDINGQAAAKLIQPQSQHAAMEVNELHEAFTALPIEQREALMLVTVLGFTYEEAAKTCGCKVGTIKSRINRGRTTLRDQLGMAGIDSDPVPGRNAEQVRSYTD